LTANRRRNDSVLREENKGENGMNGKGEPKLIFPGLAGFYASVSDLWYPMIRFAIGAILFMHGYFKVANLGIARVAANFGTNYGLPMPTFLAYAAVFLETVGAICVAIGLFTRFFAAALAIELLVAMFAAHWARASRSARAAMNMCCFSASSCSPSRSAEEAPIPSTA
jgi:putative oxidoreductase